MTGERQVERTGRENAPFVVMERITKRFPGVLANDEVDLTLADSEIHALVGENGAGKSTLMRVLYGLYPPDGGRIIVRGRAVKIASPRDAIALGIGMVHQHFVLVDRFTVTENIILGAEGGPLVDPDRSKEQLAEMMVGRPVLFRLEKPDVEIGEPVLRIEGLRVGDKLNGIDLEVRAGEILGVAGVEGNGQRELAETVMGLSVPDAGRISV